MNVTEKYVLDSAERIALTTVETFCGAMIASTAIFSVSALHSAAIAGFAAALTGFKTLAAGLLGQSGTASVLPAAADPATAPTVAVPVVPAPVAPVAPVVPVAPAPGTPSA